MGRRSLCCCRSPTELKESPETAAAEVAVAGEEGGGTYRKTLPLTRSRTASRCYRRPDAAPRAAVPSRLRRTAVSIRAYHTANPPP